MAVALDGREVLMFTTPTAADAATTFADAVDECHQCAVAGRRRNAGRDGRFDDARPPANGCMT